jgi:glyoxalase family protein
MQTWSGYQDKDKTMKKLQVQGVHHITLIGADRQTSIDFWEGVLGMPFVFEQPNLDVPEENHLYFDPGDGSLITIFTREDRKIDPTPNPEGIGNLHHLAFTVSRATFKQAAARLAERGIENTGEIDRGFMDSIYFRDPLGQLLELACYKFEPPFGVTAGEVLLEAHRRRVATGDHHIADIHLADALEALTRRTRQSLSADRNAKHGYGQDKVSD